MANHVHLKNILLKNYKEWRNIADNKGIPFSLYLKQISTQIAESYPESMKKDLSEEDKVKKDQYIIGMSEKTFKEIENICTHIGCDMSNFMKIEIKKISEKTESRLKQEPLDY